MAIRAGMQTLVDLLSALTDAGSEFTEDDLQDYLDRNKVEYRDIALYPLPQRLSNTVIYKIYPLPTSIGIYFETPIDDTVNDYFYLTNTIYVPFTFGDGDNQAVFDPNLRRITFNADTAGQFYYINAVSYDLYGAAADIWEVKIAARVKLISIKTDNHTLDMQQEYDHCVDRFNYFSQLSLKNQSTRMIRDDQGVGFNFENPERSVIRGFGPIG